ncbi:MAG TPA: hypothetical protein VG323_11470 [Thermoanaerobaculia bacterium]|nr:hypothetical protein [Thermoanaerobaculia bacterium]
MTDASTAPLPNRRADTIALITLVLLGSLLFIDVLVGVNGFYMRDLTRYYYPTKQVLRDIVLHGEFPYWNRFFSGGQPIAANPEHEVFYPLTWLILLPSYDLGFRLHILIHVYIGLLGMYALLRSMELRPFAAWFGAVAWALGGIYLSYINLLPILFCAAWLPLTCLFVRRFLLRHTVRDFALAALFLGLQFLVGEPTTVMQTGILIGMYALYRGWYAVPRISKSITRVLWIAILSAAAFAVGAAQMLPALDHVHDSARSRPFDFDLVSAWSMPWAKFGEIVYPNILGHISIKQVMWYWGGGLYTGMGSPFLFSIYVGLLVIALAVGGAFVRPRGGRLVLILCVVSALLALGGHTPLLLWLYKLGIATSIRYPEKFAMLGIFAIIVFASQMLERLMSGDNDVREGTLGFLVAATGIALVIALAGFTPLYDRVFMKIWGVTKSPQATKEIHLSHIDWIVASVRGAIAIALVWFAGKRNQRLWMAAAAIFVAADLAYTLEELNPRMPRRFFDAPLEAARLPNDRADYRVFHEVDWYGNEDPARQYFSTGDAVYWVVRNGLFPMTPAGERVQTVLERDYDKTALLPTVDLTDSVWDVKRSGRADWYEPFMAMSNAWFRAAYRPFKEEQKRTHGDFKKSEPTVFLETEHYPRYYFADQLISIRNRHDFVDKLTNGRQTPHVAFVTQPAFTPANGIVHAVRETANTATLDVESLGQGFLVMSVTRHKYWDVRVDGQRVPTVATNIAYQGIVVTPGRHRVTMEYRNSLAQIGLGVTGGISALLILVAVFWRPRIRRPRAAYEEPVHVVADASGTHVEPAEPL